MAILVLGILSILCVGLTICCTILLGISGLDYRYVCIPICLTVLLAFVCYICYKVMAGFIKLVVAFVVFCVYVVPFLARVVILLHTSLIYIMNIAVFLLNSTGHIRNSVQGIDARDHNLHEQEVPDYDDYNDVRRNIGDNDDMHRQRGHTPQRLYPDLTDFNDNSEQFEDNSDDDYVHVHTNRNHDDDQQCIICFERVRNAAIFPCGHAQMCEQCTRRIMMGRNLCPICQRRIVEYRKIYL